MHWPARLGPSYLPCSFGYRRKTVCYLIDHQVGYTPSMLRPCLGPGTSGMRKWNSPAWVAGMMKPFDKSVLLTCQLPRLIEKRLRRTQLGPRCNIPAALCFPTNSSSRWLTCLSSDQNRTTSDTDRFGASYSKLFDKPSRRQDIDGVINRQQPRSYHPVSSFCRNLRRSHSQTIQHKKGL